MGEVGSMQEPARAKKLVPEKKLVIGSNDTDADRKLHELLYGKPANRESPQVHGAKDPQKPPGYNRDLAAEGVHGDTPMTITEIRAQAQKHKELDPHRFTIKTESVPLRGYLEERIEESKQAQIEEVIRGHAVLTGRGKPEPHKPPEPMPHKSISTLEKVLRGMKKPA